MTGEDWADHMKQAMPKDAVNWAERKAWLVGKSCAFASRGGCWGPLTCDEPWPRGRGGPTNDPRNRIALCIEHNRLKSQDAETMRWAKANGYLISAAKGPAFLAAGGVQQ